MRVKQEKKYLRPKKMTILLVCNSIGGGGAERVHVNIANGFSERGHEVFLVADIYQSASYFVNDKVSILPLCPRSANKITKWMRSIFMLRKYVKLYKPDVVIGNMYLCSMLSKMSVWGTSIPVIMTIHHALESKEYKFGKLEMFLDRHTSFFYNATTVLTNADRELLAKRYHQKKNIYVMPNPLTFTPVTFREDGCMINENRECLEKEHIILAAGRLNNWRLKGWDILIKAVSKIKTELQKEGWKVQVAGGGTDDTLFFLRNMSKQAGVDDVLEFIGYQTDMEKLFQKAAVFCLSSRSEGLPMVLIEAMSQGCAPIACNNLGRTKEIITNEREGLLFKTADVDDLAKKLSIIIKDNQKRRSIQIAAIERSKAYLPVKVLEKWEHLFRDVCPVT